jgi:outer membrane protein OmpA-like peptidoglycan-associated protein
MLKYRRGLICLLIVFFPFLLTAESDSSFWWELTGQATNLTYEMTNKTLWFNANLSLLTALRLNIVTLGLENDVDYFSYNTSPEAAIALKGGWFNIRSLLVSDFHIQSWFDLKLGLGGLWLRSSLNYKNEGWVGQNQGGLSCLFNLDFDFPGFFAGIELQNKLDLLFADQSLSGGQFFNTYYSGGLRFDFRPGLSWMTFFTSFNVLYWKTVTEVFEPNIWTASIDFGLNFTSDNTNAKTPGQNMLAKNNNRNSQKIKNNTLGKTNTANKKNTTITNSAAKSGKNTGMHTDTAEKKNVVMPEKIQKDYASISPSLKQLNDSSPGKAINFPELVFKEGKTELLPGAAQILDNIAEILAARDNLIIAIAGYTEIFNEPEKEISVASSRAQFIKQYLISKGIEKSRLKINPVTHFALPNSKTRIVISIIDLE